MRKEVDRMKKRKEKFVDSQYVFEIFENGDTKLAKYKIAIIHYEGETKGQLERRLKKGILEGKVIDYPYHKKVKYSEDYIYKHAGIWAGYSLSDYINRI